MGSLRGSKAGHSDSSRVSMRTVGAGNPRFILAGRFRSFRHSTPTGIGLVGNFARPPSTRQFGAPGSQYRAASDLGDADPPGQSRDVVNRDGSHLAGGGSGGLATRTTTDEPFRGERAGFWLHRIFAAAGVFCPKSSCDRSSLISWLSLRGSTVGSAAAPARPLVVGPFVRICGRCDRGSLSDRSSNLDSQ